MALQSTGPISINNIVNELGATGSGYGATSNSIGLQNPQTTTHQNASVDDNFVTISLGFNITYNGTTYNTVYVGSNSYITFGGGASNYSGLSAATTPARPTIKMSAADNSYQRVTSGSPLGAGTKTIRFEGTGSTSGTVGSPNMVWEITFYSGSSQFNVAWGANIRGTGGTGGMTNGSTSLYTNDAVFCGTNVSYMIVTGSLSNISLNKLEVTPSFYNVSINQNSTSKPNGANPNKISEWYSYNNAATPPASVTFSSSYSLGYNGSVNGTVTIVGAVYSFKAFAVLYYGTGTVTANININGITRSASKSSTSGSSYSTSFLLGPGTYSYSVSVSINSSYGGYGGIEYIQD